jgi:hypothetical protein
MHTGLSDLLGALSPLRCCHRNWQGAQVVTSSGNVWFSLPRNQVIRLLTSVFQRLAQSWKLEKPRAIGMKDKCPDVGPRVLLLK